MSEPTLQTRIDAAIAEEPFGWLQIEGIHIPLTASDYVYPMDYDFDYGEGVDLPSCVEAKWLATNDVDDETAYGQGWDDHAAGLPYRGHYFTRRAMYREGWDQWQRSHDDDVRNGGTS